MSPIGLKNETTGSHDVPVVSFIVSMKCVVTS